MFSISFKKSSNVSQKNRHKALRYYGCGEDLLDICVCLHTCAGWIYGNKKWSNKKSKFINEFEIFLALKEASFLDLHIKHDK